MPPRPDPFRMLERTDKWYLGGGRATLFAPLFPRWLDIPGFWDEVYFADVRLETLFCVLLLDTHDRPLTLRRATRRWTPDCLTQIYTVEGRPGLRVQEERTVTPQDTLACRFTFTNTGDASVVLHAVVWSLQSEGGGMNSQAHVAIEKVEREPDGFTFVCRMIGVQKQNCVGEYVHVALGGSRLPDSWTVNRTVSSETMPVWSASVFPEKFQAGRLAQELPAPTDASVGSLLHVALHYTVEVPAGASETLIVGASLGLEREEVLTHLRADMISDVVVLARQAWRDWFESVPVFTCDDPYLQTCYWYRWYGLRLMRIAVKTERLTAPCVFEGPGELRRWSAFAAQCQVRELSWRCDAGALARGCLQSLMEISELSELASVEAVDWGTCCLQLYWLTGDETFVQAVYPGLVRNAEHFLNERDAENSGLFDSGRKAREKGIEATCYQYALQRALSVFARVLERPEEAVAWDARADDTRWAINRYLWDEADGIYKDFLWPLLQLSDVKRVAGFYPLCYDVPDEAQAKATVALLKNSSAFGTLCAAPSVSVDNADFNAEAEWKGARVDHPWNGRVWPIANSHVADALAYSARHLDAGLMSEAAEFLVRYVRMLFSDGDPKRPNSYEHYNPHTGMPSLYRGADDCQQSWIVDLILRHVVGIQPEPGAEGTLVVDPLPCGLREFRAEGVCLRGHQVDVMYDRVDGLRVIVDGVLRARSSSLERLEVVL